VEVQRQYGVETTIIFPVILAGDTDFAATGDWTPVQADCKISKDGGNFANCTNTVTAVGGTGSIGWSLTLTATEMQAKEISLQIVDSATKAVEDQFLTITTRLGGWCASNLGIIVGEVDNATFTASTTALEGLRIAPNTTEETTADHYNGRLLLFTSGAALGELTTITDYELANSKEKFTYDAIVSTPEDNATYVVI